MVLNESVAAVFSHDGVLEKAVAGFVLRVGQVEMAQAVASTIERGGQLIVEAGTGIGKSYAYLVPVLLSGHRAVISTSTKTLQDQLALRDIPQLQAAMGVQSRIAVLKGRSNYVCLERLALARLHPVAQSRAGQLYVSRIAHWAAQTQTGDLSEIKHLPDLPQLEHLVTSTRENCLAVECPQAPRCFVNRARSAALDADLVVINHHLFFADRLTGGVDFDGLPHGFSILVFDEAHQLNATGVKSLGRSWSTKVTSQLIAAVMSHSAALTLAAPDWRHWVAELATALRDLVALGTRTGQASVSWLGNSPDGVDAAQWQACISRLQRALSCIAAILLQVEQSSPFVAQLGNIVDESLATLGHFASGDMHSRVRWLELDEDVKMVEPPLDISSFMQEQMKASTGSQPCGQSWIFTSACLGIDAELSMFRATCGLAQAALLRLDSPFDYRRQSAVYIPMDLPRPGDPLHSVELAHFVAKAALVLGGRTLVLTTTLRAMRSIGDALRTHFRASGKLQVLIQGEVSKDELLKRLVDAVALGNGGGVVVVAAASLWEGVDIPGDALQLLVIDKIPFVPPDDPMAMGRANHMKRYGGNPFKDFDLHQAGMTLKQGAGRLIRRETDQGILVLGDIRLKQKNYGQTLLAALPPMQPLADKKDFDERLEQLTKLSTTNPY